MHEAARAIREDTERGAAALSLAALDALADAARGADDWAPLAALARDLRDARPAMPAVANRVNRAMAEADRTPSGVAASARAVRETAERADREAAAHAAAECGPTVLTCSRSGTVRRALDAAAPERVYVAESRPGGEGVAVAEELAADHAVTLLPDSAAASLLATGDVATVLVGADTVAPDGSVLNKVGTRGLALAATHEGVPCLAVCAADKVATGAPATEDYGGSFYEGDAPLDAYTPLFDLAPADCVRVVTEQGVIDPTGVERVAAEHRANAAWDG